MLCGVGDSPFIVAKYRNLPRAPHSGHPTHVQNNITPRELRRQGQGPSFLRHKHLPNRHSAYDLVTTRKEIQSFFGLHPLWKHRRINWGASPPQRSQRRAFGPLLRHGGGQPRAAPHGVLTQWGLDFQASPSACRRQNGPDQKSGLRAAGSQFLLRGTPATNSPVSRTTASNNRHITWPPPTWRLANSACAEMQRVAPGPRGLPSLLVLALAKPDNVFGAEFISNPILPGGFVPR